jgi:quercetin dioxygenase-like cupin family protein
MGETNMIRILLVLTLGLSLTGCASGPPKLPYPAFVQADELGDVFLASLPGTRAKQLAGDPMTRRTSNRIDLPSSWQGTSGGAPGRSMEIFVLDGVLLMADIELTRGGYAFLPAGSLGFNMRTEEGARILYFVNDVDPESIIRSPIIINADLLEWEPTAWSGISTKELRKDPGNGATTWLLRIEAGADVPWESSSAVREGYLVSGTYQHGECFLGEAQAGGYTAGGYFFRPANTVNGGPLSGGETDAIWFLRETNDGKHEMKDGCEPVS